MMRQQLAAAIVAVSLTGTSLLAQQPNGLISGTAKDEAKKPYTDYSVRARDVRQGQIAATTPLDSDGAFSLPNLGTANYLVELVNKNGKVVCTEGPYDLDKLPNAMKAGVVIDCNKIPVAWWLVGIATAAGITAGVTTTGNDTPPTPTTFSVPPTSPAR